MQIKKKKKSQPLLTKEKLTRISPITYGINVHEFTTQIHTYINCFYRHLSISNDLKSQKHIMRTKLEMFVYYANHHMCLCSQFETLNSLCLLQSAPVYINLNSSTINVLTKFTTKLPIPIRVFITIIQTISNLYLNVILIKLAFKLLTPTSYQPTNLFI